MAGYGTKSCPPWIQPITLAQLGPDPVVPDFVGFYALVVHSISLTHELHLFDGRHVLRLMLSSTVADQLDEDRDDLGLTSTNLVGHVVALDGLRIVPDLDSNPPTLVGTVKKLTPFCEREKRPVCRMSPIERDPAICAALMAKRADVVKHFALPSFGAQPEQADTNHSEAIVQPALPPKDLLANLRDFSRTPRLRDGSVLAPSQSIVEEPGKDRDAERDGGRDFRASEKAVMVAHGSSYPGLSLRKANEYERSLSGSSDDDSAPPLSIRDVEVSDEERTPLEDSVKPSDRDLEFLRPNDMALEERDESDLCKYVPIMDAKILSAPVREPESSSRAELDAIIPNTIHNTSAGHSQGSVPAAGEKAAGIVADSVAEAPQTNDDVPDRLDYTTNPQRQFVEDGDDDPSILNGATGSIPCDKGNRGVELVAKPGTFDTSNVKCLPGDAALNPTLSHTGLARVGGIDGREQREDEPPRTESMSHRLPPAKPPTNTQPDIASGHGVCAGETNDEQFPREHEASRNVCGNDGAIATKRNATRQNVLEEYADPQVEASTSQKSWGSQMRTGADTSEANMPKGLSSEDIDASTHDEDPTLLSMELGAHEVRVDVKTAGASAVGVLTQAEILKVGVEMVRGATSNDIPPGASLTQHAAMCLDMNPEDFDDDEDLGTSDDSDVGSWRGQNLNLETQQMIVSDSEDARDAEVNRWVPGRKYSTTEKKSDDIYKDNDALRVGNCPSGCNVQIAPNLENSRQSSETDERKGLTKGLRTDSDKFHHSGQSGAQVAQAQSLDSGLAQEVETRKLAQIQRRSDCIDMDKEVIGVFHGAGSADVQKLDSGGPPSEGHGSHRDGNLPTGSRICDAPHAAHAPRFRQVSQPGQVLPPTTRLKRVVPSRDSNAEYPADSRAPDFGDKSFVEYSSDADFSDSCKISCIRALKEKTKDQAALEMIETISVHMRRLDYLERTRKVDAWKVCLAPVAVMRTADDIWNGRFRRRSAPIRRTWRGAGDAKESSHEKSIFDPKLGARERSSLPVSGKQCRDPLGIEDISSPGITLSPREPAAKRPKLCEGVTKSMEAPCAKQGLSHELGKADGPCPNVSSERLPSAELSQGRTEDSRRALDLNTSDLGGGWFDKVNNKPDSCDSLFAAISKPVTADERMELCAVAAFVGSSLRSKLNSLTEVNDSQ
jgi:hypothetical protein